MHQIKPECDVSSFLYFCGNIEILRYTVKLISNSKYNFDQKYLFRLNHIKGYEP